MILPFDAEITIISGHRDYSDRGTFKLFKIYFRTVTPAIKMIIF